MPAMPSTCRTAYVMVNGQIRLSGSGQTLLNDPEVRKAYLRISG